jgi:hypothetical protein
LHDGLLALGGDVILVLCQAFDDASAARLNIRAELLRIALARGSECIEQCAVRSWRLLRASQ